MTQFVLCIAQWSAENQTLALAAWVVIAGLVYWAAVWIGHIRETRRRIRAIRDAIEQYDYCGEDKWHGTF